MKTKFNNWLFKIAKKVIAINIVKQGTQLKPKYLIDCGWIEENGYYIEPNIKDRDRISISFESHYYRVWHSDKQTFLSLQTTVEWFDIYCLLCNRNDALYKLAGI
jgi:hypothetical protein